MLGTFYNNYENSTVSRTLSADTSALLLAENSTAAAAREVTPQVETKFKMPPKHDDPLSLWDVVRVLCVMAVMVALICWVITGGWHG